MLLIVGTVRLPAAMIERARPAMKRMVEETRAEHGCLEYSYAEDVLDPGLIHVTELWLDQGSLDRHLASTHIAEWRSTWPTFDIRDRQLRAYSVGEPRQI